MEDFVFAYILPHNGLIIACFFMIIISINIYVYMKYKSLPTFQEYKKKHAMSKAITCIECGGSSIYCRNIGFGNQHICRTCGTALYRSKSA